MNYTWEAEKQDGTVITEGGDLSGCIRFSAIPVRDDLPRHDIIGKKFIHRFNRGFKKTVFGDYRAMLLMLEDRLTEDEKSLIAMVENTRDVVVDQYKKTRTDSPENITMHNIMRSKIKSAEEKIKKVVQLFYFKYFPSEQYFLCAVFRGGRVYINAFTGAVLCTPEKYELYV